jgi:hypothetical protein
MATHLPPNFVQQFFDLKKRVDRALRFLGGIGCVDGMQWGTATTSAVSGIQSVHITFPWAFTDTPNVQITALSSAPGTVVECSANNVSTTGFDLLVDRTSATATVANWLAIN